MGRHLIFETPKELETAIDDYFTTCDAGEDVEELNKRGEMVQYRRKIPYTMEGLALNLDCDTSTLRYYAKRDKFFTVISRARKKIYDSWLKRGLTGEYNPKIVALCLAAHNPEYRVNQQHEITVETVEDKLRRIAAQTKQIEYSESIPDAEVEEDI